MNEPLTEEQQKLVESCIPIAWREAYRHSRHTGRDIDDIASEALHELCMSARRYQSKEAKFITYAVSCIRFRLRGLSRSTDALPFSSLSDSNVDFPDRDESDVVMITCAINKVKSVLTEEEYNLLWERYGLCVPPHIMAVKHGIGIPHMKKRLQVIISVIRSNEKLCCEMRDL